MSPAARDLAALAGSRLAHVTMAGNAKSIMSRGLFCPRDLCVRHGVDPASIRLRGTRCRVGPAQLNHQRPILHGLGAAAAMLDGYTPQSWAGQLDGRVFFWPERDGERFAASLRHDGDVAVIWLDTAKVADALARRIELSPINSGNFRQGGARVRRGDWLYVPLTAGAAAFRGNRVARGLVGAPDRLREVSVRGSIPADVLAGLVAR